MYLKGINRKLFVFYCIFCTLTGCSNYKNVEYRKYASVEKFDEDVYRIQIETKDVQNAYRYVLKRAGEIALSRDFDGFIVLNKSSEGVRSVVPIDGSTPLVFENGYAYLDICVVNMLNVNDINLRKNLFDAKKAANIKLKMDRSTLYFGLTMLGLVIPILFYL